MNRRFVHIALAAAVLGPVASPAQMIAAQTQGNGARRGTLTLELVNVPLVRALNEIATQSGMRIIRETTKANLDQQVSVRVSNVSVEQALATATRGTGVVTQVSDDRSVILVKVVGRSQRALAQGVVAGKVTDSKTGRGISGARVTIGKDNHDANTTDEGTYRITGVAPGTHTVAVRLVGYAKQTRTVTVGEGTTATVDFKLEPSANVLDQVIVTGTQTATELKAVPNAITVITAKQLEERGITHIEQLFRGEVPGVFSLDQGAYGGGIGVGEIVMYSRGATKISTNTLTHSGITNNIKTYVDGIEVVDPQYITQIDPKSIERIEILTGPQASTIYGANAINGVMQVFTKRGNSPRPAVKLSFMSGVLQNDFTSTLTPTHQHDGSISGMEGRLSYNLGGGWDFTGAWNPSTRLQRTSVYGSTRYELKGLSLDLSARNGWSRANVRGNISQFNIDQTQDGRYIYNNFQTSGISSESDRVLMGRTYSTTVGYNPFSWWSHQATVGSDASDTETIYRGISYITTSDTMFGFNNRSPNQRNSQSYTSTLRIPFGSVAQGSLTYGADHWRTASSRVEWQVSPASGAIVNSGVTRNKPQKNTGAYVQGQFGLYDALFLTYGVRADWNPNYGDLARVRPGRYGLSYAKEFGVVSAKLRGSYGRSIRPPDPNLVQGALQSANGASNIAAIALYAAPGTNLYQTLPTPDLGPEFQQGGEGGVEFYVGNRGSLVVTRYNQTVDGLITSVNGADSARALLPGFQPVSVIGCINGATAPVASPRSDGYCYYVQRKNLNVGSIRNQGWELQGSVNTGPITTRGTYTWSKSRVVGVTPAYRRLLTDIAFLPGQSFNYMTEHTWALNFSYALGKTTALLNLNGIGQTLRRADVGNLTPYLTSRLRFFNEQAYSVSITSTSPIARVPQEGYTTANLNLSHRLTSKVEALAQFNNLTNFYRNDVSIEYPTLGRQSRVGFRWRW